MSNPSNVKTLNTPVPVHGKSLDTLVINAKKVVINYDVPTGSPSGTVAVVSAQVGLTNSASVVNGVITTPMGQQPGSNAITANYSAPVTATDQATVYAAIFAQVTTVAGYTYSA